MDRIDFKDWYIWPYQFYSGDYNMFIDHWLARYFEKILDKPILRFYGWHPPCISLGYHQNASDINRDFCKSKSIDVVRRPTGGRAILHAQELTYSMIYPYRNLDISNFYRLIHIPFVLALQELGIHASFEPSQADFQKIYKTDRAFLCFATSAKYEVEIEGKKLIGSAQRVYEKAILQHGSVLLGPQHQKLVNFLNISELRQSEMKRYISEHTTTVWDYQNKITAGDLSESIREKFSLKYDITFHMIQENEGLFEKITDLPDFGEFSILKNLENSKKYVS